MLRRSAPRPISAFNFGQPDLYSGFARSLFVKPSTTLPDQGVVTTKLPNGVKVITHDQGGALSTVATFVEAGPQYDPLSAPGLSQMMRYGILSSNMVNSTFQIDRAMRAHGAAYAHREVGKSHLAWSATTSRTLWRSPLEHLATGLVCPRFHESDLERYRDTVDNELEEQRWQHPREYCIDQVERFAFFKNPLGSPRTVLPDTNDHCSHEKLLAHWCTHFQPSRVTIAGINVPHEDLVAAYTSLPTPHSALAPHHATADPLKILSSADQLKQYTGGNEGYEQEKREKAMGTKPHMEKESILALAWPTFGSQGDINDYATALVLKELVGVSLDSGINYERHDSHTGVRCFYRPYSTAGLFGVTLRGDPYEVVKELSSVYQLNANISNSGVAKARAEVAFLNTLESQEGYLDFIATSPHTIDSVVAAVRTVSDGALTKAYEASKAQLPCMYATGDTLKLPSVRQVAHGVKH